MLRSSWGADQFARGSYSYPAPGSDPAQRATLREPLGDRVFFAGEATSDDQFATVAGALESGVRAAADVQAATGGVERIAVIGAGAAGATVANRLVGYGHTVTVLEARDRIGGRIATVNKDDWPVPVELGAMWVRGERGANLSATLGSLQVMTADVSGPAFQVTATGTKASPSDDGERAVASARSWAADQPEDTSLADALEKSGAGDVSESGDPSPAQRLDAYLRERVALPFGAVTDDFSSWYGEPGAEPGGELVLGDYSKLVADLVDGIDVRLSTAVTAVSHSDSGVSLRLSTGEGFSVDRVVVTVPLGVLQRQGIEFDPALPFAQRAAIADLGVGTADSVWLRFDEAFWDTDAVLWSVLGGDAAIADWVNLQPLTGEPVLVGFVGAEAADALAELDDAGVIAAARASLAPFVAAG
jgi:monoamine oxidase